MDNKAEGEVTVNKLRRGGCRAAREALEWDLQPFQNALIPFTSYYLALGSRASIFAH